MTEGNICDGTARLRLFVEGNLLRFGTFYFGLA